MNQPEPVRLLPVAELPRFARALVKGLHARETDRERLLAILAQTTRVECQQCHIRLSGEDLLGLSDLELPDGAALAKVTRLRLGYCARNGCLSQSYELHWSAQPGFSLDEALGGGATPKPESAPVVGPGLESADPLLSPGRRKVLRLLCAGGAVFALLLIRQWRLGGRIPFLREPEAFGVGCGHSGTGCGDPNCPYCGQHNKARMTAPTNSPTASSKPDEPPLIIVLPEEK